MQYAPLLTFLIDLNAGYVKEHHFFQRIHICVNVLDTKSPRAHMSHGRVILTSYQPPVMFARHCCCLALYCL